MRSHFLGLGLAIASIFLGAISNAQTFNGGNLFKVNRTVYYTNVPSSSSVTLTVRPGTTKTTYPTATACGLIRVKWETISDEKVAINGNQIITNGLPIQLLPSCSNSGQLSEPRTTPFVARDGYAYFPGYAPNQPVTLTYKRDYVVTRKPNQCGVVRFTLPKDFELLPNSYFAATDGNDVDDQRLWSEYPDAQIPPKCLSVNGNYVRFIPTGITGW